MVAKINHGSNLYGALAYNQQKVDGDKGKVLGCNLVLEPADGKFNAYSCAEDFERFMPSHIRTKKPVVHISLNPHPDDKLTDVQLTDLGRQYLERLGYGGQPYMIFKHEDIDRRHIHLVTTRVRTDGSLVPDKFEKDRSSRIVAQLEKDFNLLPAKGQKQGEAWRLTPVDAAAGNLKKQISGVIKPLSEMYRFQSFAEYRALLSLYNIGIEKVEGNNKGNRYEGLVYSALDADGKRAGKPLKSSLLGKTAGIAALDKRMKESGEMIKSGKAVAGTKATVAEALQNARTESRLREALQKKGIDLVLRRNDTGRIYGATFIDHNSRTVINGSRLGKEFSANALNERFANDTHREDLHAPARKPATAPAGKKSVTELPDMIAAGGLLSVFTPEFEGQNENPPAPRRRKKKKRRYGRQM
ncbi:mobilization protein [Parabacteroides sp. AF48-14]|uniref:conjugal transfer protein MobB n=1 Tax=Parabacteroides sp. AF48-14 TaxID=2292052 RepID=UPI000F002761|nr:conjugal transfer protein MobB [Parabacteroides sp. AF48-14]RHO67066.1 mobilization protein [Parabacteroides sp. AF48-14]